MCSFINQGQVEGQYHSKYVILSTYRKYEFWDKENYISRVKLSDCNTKSF